MSFVTTRTVTTCPPAHHFDDRSRRHGTGGSIPFLPGRTLPGHRRHILVAVDVDGDQFRAHPHKFEHRRHNLPPHYQIHHIVPQPRV